MAESPLSPVSGGAAGGVSEVGMNVVVDLHSSASAMLNENSTASTGSTAGIFVPVDLQCPATPHLNLKLPDLSTSSSESDDETALAMALEAGDGLCVRNTSSPPPNCAICLGRCKNKCFTDSCMHQFCFKCLCEWSKVKPECPLCKQTFKSIIHNVKSIDQFEEYHVVTPPTLQFRQTVELNMLRHIESNLRLPYQADNNRRWEDFEVALNNVPRAHRLMRTARTTFYPSSSSSTATAAASGAGTAAAGAGGTVATTVPNNGNVQNQFVHRGELLDMYRQEYPDAITSGGSLSGTLSQLWRRYVYDRKLYALPVCDITGRFRESSARFYRDNPAQIHRLVPWINRDIVCLLRNTEHDVSFVLERINEWLIMTNILSPLFRRRLQPILGTKTAHFIHELNNFARSPYDMIGYDRAVQYSPQNTEEIVIEFSSSSSSSAGGRSSDEEQVNVVDGGAGVASSASAVDGTNDAGSTVANATTSRTHRSRSRNTQAQTSASRAREYRVQSRATANTASNTPPMINLLSFTISTTSEGVEAPGVSVATVASVGRGSQSAAINLSTHNRTSDVIIDLDDTDIDNSTTTTTSTTGVLQYAPPAAGANVASALPTPTVTENIELSSTSSSDECEFVLERKPPHLRTPEMVSLNSESDSDVVFVEEDEDRKPMRHATETGASTEDQLKCVTRTMLKKLEATEHEQRSNEQRTKMEDPEEYNVGASTSAGLRSSGRRRRQKSIDMEKSKLKKQERRKRTLRSTKDSGHPGRAESTSSDSDGGNLAQEVAAYREKQRLKRMKKKFSETKRTPRRTASSTKTKVKNANNMEGPRMIRTTRMRKRKYSVHDEQSDGGDGNGNGGRASKERRYGDSHTERSVESDSSNSATDEMDTALRKLSKEFSKTIAGLKQRLADNESGSEFTPSTTNNQEREEEREEEVEVEMQQQQPVECVVKYEHDEAGNMMEHSSEDNNNERDDDADDHVQEEEEEEEEGSNFTANSLNNMQNIESTAATAAPTEPSSTTTTTTTSAQQQPQQAQQQAADDTISLNIHITSPKTRCSSYSSRSSIYTSSTTSSSESSTTTSSSSSSSTSYDSDDGDDIDGRSTTKAYKEEESQEELEQQQQQEVFDDCYNMMNLETLDAATTEAVAALASLRNSNQQQLVASRHPYLDINDNHDANHNDDDENENDEM